MNTFEQKFIVELADITTNFGLKPTTVFKYYQETFARYCAKFNIAGYDLYKMGLKWVFGQTVANFTEIIPIWNEEVTTKVYISNVKKLRMYIDFEISSKRGLVAKGQSIAYVLDADTSEPKPVKEIVDKFQIDTAELNNETAKFRFEPTENIVSELEHVITFSDLDYNNHTNNISYISLAFEGMPADYVSEKFPAKIEIKYLQETFLKDTLKCETTRNNDCFSYKITNQKDNSDVCLINACWNNKNIRVNEFFETLQDIRKN